MPVTVLEQVRDKQMRDEQMLLSGISRIGMPMPENCLFRMEVINGNSLLTGLPLKTKNEKTLDREPCFKYPCRVTFTFQGGES